MTHQDQVIRVETVLPKEEAPPPGTTKTNLKETLDVQESSSSINDGWTVLFQPLFIQF
jgi:hypothetical protein